MPRGGKRRGAGRKPAGGRVLAMPGCDRRLPERPATEPEVGPPADAEPEVLEVWALLAPGALERGTLTAATVRGFVCVCEEYARHRAIKARIDAEGWTYADQFGNPKRHPLFGVESSLKVRIEQMLARFGLLPDGKVAAAPVAAPVSNPWAAIAPGFGAS